MNLAKATAAVLIASQLAGCYTLQYNGAYMADDSASFSRQKGAKVDRTIHAEDRAIFIVAGLIPISTPDIERTIRREAGGRKIQGIRIQSQMSFTDALLTIGSILGIGFIGGAASGGNPSSLAAVQVLASVIAPQFRTITVDAEVIAE